MATKQCKRCFRELPIERFHRDGNAIRCTCKDCRNANTRACRQRGAYKVDAALKKIRDQRSLAKRKARKWWLEPTERAKRIATKTASRRAAGIGPKQFTDYWALNARQAWKYWLRVLAPDEWVAAYWMSIGEPWRNPRLSNARRFKIRYELDAEFNSKQRDKAQRINPERKAKIDLLSDGTITPQFIRSLFAATTHCPYCTVRMASRDKSLDHIEPLDPGLHTASNVCVCCKTCNTRKRRMPLAVFMQRYGSRRAA